MSDDFEGAQDFAQADWSGDYPEYGDQQAAYDEPEQAAWQDNTVYEPEGGWQEDPAYASPGEAEGTQYESQYTGAYAETDQPGTQIENQDYTMSLESGPGLSVEPGSDLSLESGPELNQDLSPDTGEPSGTGEPDGPSDGKAGKDEEDDVELEFEGSAEELRAMLAAQFPDGDFEIDEVEEGAA